MERINLRDSLSQTTICCQNLCHKYRGQVTSACALPKLGTPSTSQGSPFPLGTPLTSPSAHTFILVLGSQRTNPGTWEPSGNWGWSEVGPSTPSSHLAASPLSLVLSPFSYHGALRVHQHITFRLELKGQEMNSGLQQCSEQREVGPCASLLCPDGLQSIVFNSSLPPPPPRSILKLNLTEHFNKLIFENGLFWMEWSRGQESQYLGLTLNLPPQGSPGPLVRTLKSFLHTPPQRHFTLGNRSRCWLTLCLQTAKLWAFF